MMNEIPLNDSSNPTPATRPTVNTQQGPPPTQTSVPKEESWFQSIGKALEEVATETKAVLKEIGQEIHGIITSDSYAIDRYRALNLLEPLLSEFSCKAVNGNVSLLPGNCFISENHFSFSAYVDVGNNRTNWVKVILPWSNIKEIKQAVDVPSYNPILPVIIPIIHPQIRPTVIQLFTNDNQVHQFLGFQTKYEIAWNEVVSAYKKWQQKHKTETKPTTTETTSTTSTTPTTTETTTTTSTVESSATTPIKSTDVSYTEASQPVQHSAQ